MEPKWFSDTSPLKQAIGDHVELIKQTARLNQADLVKYTIKHAIVPDITTENLHLTKRELNLDQARALKEAGNALFKEGRHLEAREKYTESIGVHPVDWDNPSQNEEFAITLANRSATMDCPGSFQACVNDINMALKYGYPKKLQYKVFKRKGHALLRLKQYIESKTAYAKCLDMIGKSDLPSKARDELRARTKKNMNIFNVSKSLQDTLIEKPVPRPLGADDSSPVSTHVEIKDSEVWVTQDIPPGSSIWSEKTTYAVLSDTNPNLPRICPHALLPMVAPIPCSYGGQRHFSHDGARKEANDSYQRYEWPLDSTFMRQNIGLSPYGRLVLRMTLSIGSPPVLKPGTEQANKAEQDVENIEDDSAQLTDEQKLERSVLIATLYKFLGSVEFFSSFTLADCSQTEDYFTAAALRAIRAVKHSSQPMRFYKLAKGEDVGSPSASMSNTIYALGLFPAISHLKTDASAGMLSEANSVGFFTFNHLVVLNFRPLLAGESVIFALPPLDEHVKEKAENAIGANSTQPVNDMITFKCSNLECSASFPLKENTREKVVQCPSCQKDTNVWLKLTKIQELKQRWSAWECKLKDGDPTLALAEIWPLWAEWNKIVLRPYQDIQELEKHAKFLLQVQQLSNERAWLNDYR